MGGLFEWAGSSYRIQRLGSCAYSPQQSLRPISLHASREKQVSTHRVSSMHSVSSISSISVCIGQRVIIVNYLDEGFISADPVIIIVGYWRSWEKRMLIKLNLKRGSKGLLCTWMGPTSHDLNTSHKFHPPDYPSILPQMLAVNQNGKDQAKLQVTTY